MVTSPSTPYNHYSTRVIEALEYFDAPGKEASVMQIARRFGRPQSSTSELLCNLVELGILQRNVESRLFSLGPRAAFLGLMGQADLIQYGQIARLLDHLVEATGLSVVVHTMIGVNLQVACKRRGRTADALQPAWTGSREPLTASPAGWLHLSTLHQEKSVAVSRRLNAEAHKSSKFDYPSMIRQVAWSREVGYAVGRVGDEPDGSAVSLLLPDVHGGYPLTVSLVYRGHSKFGQSNLLPVMKKAVQTHFPDVGAGIPCAPKTHLEIA